MLKRCEECNTEFNCDSDSTCWCTELPAIFPMNESAQCLCPVCLKKEVLLKTQDNSLHFASKALSGNKAVKSCGTIRLIEGIDYHLEQGNYVFTEWYHLKRGHCCQNKCRHCPYDKK